MLFCLDGVRFNDRSKLGDLPLYFIKFFWACTHNNRLKGVSLTVVLILAHALELRQPFFHKRTHALLEIFAFERFRHPGVGLGHGFT